ncbi:MAG: hypothetical protein IJG34_07540 [Synergistaceae bacterium]|nr:hypothetical protein [Synergistaceae bacterium]MBR0250400.1 hypothetical protein [Synergistaceae bacterium]
MSEVTIVCCYNNEAIYNDFVNTLKTQTCPYELIGIDNSGNGRFTSCAAAYNSVINDVKTKYVIYSHQDILLQDSDTLAKFVSYLDRIKRDDILGVAGVKFNIKRAYTNIKQIDNRTEELIFAGAHRLESDFMECDTVDECFFGGYTEHFRNYLFDDAVCDNWHLYAAEACLRTKSNTNGGQIYICDINLIHRSSGNVNFAFVYDFCKLCRKYHKHFSFINTSCGRSKTDIFHLGIYVLYRLGISILNWTRMYDIVKRLLRIE